MISYVTVGYQLTSDVGSRRINESDATVLKWMSRCGRGDKSRKRSNGCVLCELEYGASKMELRRLQKQHLVSSPQPPS